MGIKIKSWMGGCRGGECAVVDVEGKEIVFLADEQGEYAIKQRAPFIAQEERKQELTRMARQIVGGSIPPGVRKGAAAFLVKGEWDFEGAKFHSWKDFYAFLKRKGIGHVLVGGSPAAEYREGEWDCWHYDVSLPTPSAYQKIRVRGWPRANYKY